MSDNDDIQTEVVLVSCSKTKLDGVYLARNLYDPSSIFRKRRRFGGVVGDHWGILSAKYGYLRPWDVVGGYSTHRKDRSGIWAAWVLSDLLPDLEFWGADQVTFLAGKLYVDPLIAELEDRGYDVWDYNRGLRSGERESALKELVGSPEREIDIET